MDTKEATEGAANLLGAILLIVAVIAMIALGLPWLIWAFVHGGWITTRIVEWYANYMMWVLFA